MERTTKWGLFRLFIVHAILLHIAYAGAYNAILKLSNDSKLKCFDKQKKIAYFFNLIVSS